MSHALPARLLLGLLALALPPFAVAQSPWLDLGDVGGHRTAIDTTATVRLADGLATVHLRLANFVGAGVDEIQALQVDCRRNRSRLLAARDTVISASPIGEASVGSPTVSDSAWKEFGPGSLGAEQVRVVCRFLRGRDRGRG
jgi:hypothetical protein